MITSGGALVGLFVGGAIGRQGQSRQWLRDARTAAYREYLKQCSMLEIELREAYLATRANAVDWDAVLAAQTALSLVADPRSSQAALALTDVLNQLASLGDQPRPTSDSEFPGLLSAVARAQLEFVNAARRSLYRSQRPLGAHRLDVVRRGAGVQCTAQVLGAQRGLGAAPDRARTKPIPSHRP